MFQRLKECIKRNKILYSFLLKCYRCICYIGGGQKYRKVQEFFRKQGNDMLRESSFLNSDSVVFELGGYKGDWVGDIYEKYLCNCYVFEPIEEFCDVIRMKFQDVEKVHIYNMGIGVTTYDSIINVSEDGSSVYDKNGNRKIKIKAIKEFLEENRIDRIDFIQINIEGGEYDILEWLIESGDIKQIKILQIQFHDRKEIDSKRRMEDIQINLEKTHTLEWAFRPYVWERWISKEM